MLTVERGPGKDRRAGIGRALSRPATLRPMRTAFTLAALFATLPLTWTCLGQEGPRVPASALAFRPGPEEGPQQPSGEDIPPKAQREGPGPFGSRGGEYLTFGAGIAHDFGDVTDLNIRGSYSIFLIQDVEFSLELNAWYFAQPGADAVGLNPAMDFRWHFYNGENPAFQPSRWSVYADLGIGLLVASDEVPSGGSAFDFMPKAGIGLTRRLDDAGTRLQVGVQWHHVSNARITGDSKNPGLDAPFLYFGVMVRF
jgi:lipid A 3-O-deacylase